MVITAEEGLCRGYKLQPQGSFIAGFSKVVLKCPFLLSLLRRYKPAELVLRQDRQLELENRKGDCQLTPLSSGPVWPRGYLMPNGGFGEAILMMELPKRHATSLYGQAYKGWPGGVRVRVH